MADRQQPSEAVWILGGIGVIALVAYLASRRPSGNVMQPTAPEATSQTSQAAPVTTNSLAFDSTALSDPLTSIPSGAFGGSMTSPGQYVQLPSGTVVPFMQGVDYAIGTVIHYADGSVQIL